MHSGISHFKEEAVSIQQHFPELVYLETQDGLPSIEGTLTLLDEQGGYVDNYSIRIMATPTYPFSFPYVYETSNRIPKNIDWHLFPDGHCCIKSVPEEIFKCKGGLTLIDFIETEVKPFFFNQKYRELFGYFLKERAHGTQGNIEFFKDVLKTKIPHEIVTRLKFINKRNEPNRVSRCFCGSGLKYRKCHREAYRLLIKFSNHEIDFFISMF